MYNDSTFNNLFTGYKSGSDYIYPEGSQNLVVKFTDFYLSAKDGDFTTDPVTITSETGEGEDISIGNAPAKVLTATMLNPDGAMDALTWGDGTVYIGCETATATADTYNSYPVHILAGSVHYGINSSGNARRNSTNYTLGGTPVAVISNSAGNDVLFITDTKIGRYNGSFSTITTPTAEQAYLAAKMRAMPYSVGVLLDANGCPSVYNSVEKNTKQTFGYVPMGLFDFSNVDAYGITFGVEAYDKMTVFDADATAWWNAIDFDNGGSGRRLDWLADELCQHYGFSSPTVSNDAVNGGVVWTANPITSYAVTGRDLLKWLGEAMGCNVRMGRTGGVELWTFPLEILSPPTPVTPVATITPDTIISNTRVKGKAEIPKLNQVQCYNVLGAGYEYHTGTPGTYTPLYIVANPFIDPSGGGSELSNIYGVVSRIPAFYPTTISVACGDPRWDAGDFVCITTTDGSPQFNIPIMHETLAWNGTCVTYLAATGKQVRDIPESMLNTDLSSMVDSNPSAVVNKIMTKGITVYDSNNNVLFSAIGDNHLVEIAGFEVDKTSLHKTTESPTDVFNTVYVGIDKVASEKVDTTQGFAVSNTATMENGWMQVYENNPDPNGSHVYYTSIHPDYIFFHKNDNGTVLQADYSAEEAILNSTYDSKETSITKDSVSVTDGTNTATTTASSYSTTDGTNTASLVSTGVTFDDGTASSKLSVIKRLHDSANMTDNITLQRGVYLAIVSHTNNSTAGQQGLYVIQAYDTNSVVLTIAAAANSTLTVSGLTLTWTTTNTYRALRLIYLS